MTFIKLSTTILNTTKISSIRTQNDKYYINMLHTSISGIYLGLYGSISSYQNQFIVCKQIHKDDYNIMTNWINTHAKSSFEDTKI